MTSLTELTEIKTKLFYIFFIFLIFSYKSVFSFCDVIPQNIDEAREFLAENIIDSVCFNAVEILFLSSVNPIEEGWFRFESIGFDLSEDDLPIINELRKNAETSGNLTDLFRKYPALSEFENFIFIPKHSAKIYPIKSSISISARRTDGNNEQYYAISSVNRFNDNLQVSAQIREQNELPYLQNRSVSTNFNKKNFIARISAGNLISPSNELLFGRYATFSQASGNENILYGSIGGYNGVIAQAGIKQVGALGYFHAKPEEHLAGGGFFVQPKNFRIETIAIHGEKNIDERSENLIQIKGELPNYGISVSNAFGLNSQKTAALLKYEKSQRNTRILSQIWFMQEGFDSPFSSLIARNDTLKHKKIGSEISIRSNQNTQKFSALARYQINGDLGKAQIFGSYNFPEITGFGCRSNFTIKSDSTKLKQSHTVFHKKKIAKLFRTNVSAANTFEETEWKQSIFTAGLDNFLPNNQQIYVGFSEKIRKEKSSQETIYLSYKTSGNSKNTRSLAIDLPLYETTKGMRIYGEMRFAFPVSDNCCM